MSSLALRVDRFARRIGVAGVIGILFLSIVPGYYWTVIRPLQKELAERSDQQRELLDQRSPNNQSQIRAQQLDARLRAFHDFFPTRDTAPNWIAQISQAADAVKIRLERGNYQTAVQKGQSPIALRITLPVKGSYAQIRQFVAGALQNVPTLALDGITFQRKSPRDGELEAEVRFSLFLTDE